MENSLLVQDDAAASPDGSFLSSEEKLKIVQLLYAGRTLFSICQQLDIDRQAVDLEQRFDPDFQTAMTFAVEALGDTQAEQALEVLLRAEWHEDDPKQSVFELNRAKALAAHLKWMSDRTGHIYQSRKARSGENKRPKDYQTNLPEPDAQA